eukprot:2120643-Pleurochrysis_carterae.AAC.1
MATLEATAAGVLKAGSVDRRGGEPKMATPTRIARGSGSSDGKVVTFAVERTYKMTSVVTKASQATRERRGATMYSRMGEATASGETFWKGRIGQGLARCGERR